MLSLTLSSLVLATQLQMAVQPVQAPAAPQTHVAMRCGNCPPGIVSPTEEDPLEELLSELDLSA